MCRLLPPVSIPVSVQSVMVHSEKYVLYFRKTHREFSNMSGATISETIYVVKDRDGNCRYVGRTRLPLARRLQKHSEQLRTDWLACPLYRFMHQENATFNQDDWTIEPLATVAFPDADLGAMIENEAIEHFRRTYPFLGCTFQ